MRPTYFLTAILAILASSVVQGQAQDTSCLNQLSPCINYLNGSRDPPSTCCDPLKDVISSNPECICSLISNQGAEQAKQMGINLTAAQQLPAKCGEAINPVGCLKSEYDMHQFCWIQVVALTCCIDQYHLLFMNCMELYSNRFQHEFSFSGAPSPQSSAGSLLGLTSCTVLVLTLPLFICQVLQGWFQRFVF